MESSELKSGMKVRLYSSRKTSVVVGKSHPSEIDGTERWEVRVDESGQVARINPAMLMPVDQPLADDPPFVVLSPSYQGKKIWAVKTADGTGYTREESALDADKPDPPAETIIEPVDLKAGIWAIHRK